MQLQYISDNKGHTTAIQLQIPIEVWEQLKKKYKEFAVEEQQSLTFSVPEWHKDLVRKEKELIAEGKIHLQSWEMIKNNFNL